MLRSRKSHHSYETYLKTHPKLECVFCHPKPEVIIEQTEHMLVLRNIFPYELWDFGIVTDHLMAIPKRHIIWLDELSDAEMLDYMKLVAKYEKKGYNLYARSDLNKVAKSVAHEHMHLIKTKGPRRRQVIFTRKPYVLWHR